LAPLLTRTRDLILVIAGLTAACVIMLWPVVRSATHALPGELRDPLLEAWTLAWNADHLRHFFRGVWDLPILYPYRETLAFSEHLIGVAIFTAPLQWATGNAIVVYNVAFFASYVFAGAAMFLLARELTGDTGAAVVAGVIFAFYPHHVAQSAHLQNIVVGWMPIALLGLHRYFSTGSRRALAVAAVAYWFEAMSNGYYLFYFGLAVAIVAIWGLLRADRAARPRMLRDFAVAAIVVGVAYAPVAKRYLDVRHRYGQVRSSDEIVRFAADVGSYFTLPPPVAEHIGFTLPQYPKPAGPEERHDGMLFPGFSMVALAVVACATTLGRTWNVPALYLVIAATGFVMSLGPQPTMWGHRILPAGPYAFFAATVPGFNGLRVPARMAVLVFLGLTVLAAFGAARILRAFPDRRRPIVAGAIALFTLFESYGAIDVAEVGRRGRTRDFGLYSWLAYQPAGAVLELPVGPLDRDYRAFIYQYNTLIHRHPIVNGWVGYSTNLQQWLGRDGSPFVEPGEMANALDLMRGLGVRYVVVHPDDFVPRDAGPPTLDALTAARAKWIDMRQFGTAYAFVLPPPPARPPPHAMMPIDPASVHVTTSDRLDLARWLLDGRRDSIWTSGEPQNGSEWIELQFDRETDVTRLRLEMDDSILSDYPRALTVDAIDAHGAVRLFDGSVMIDFGRSFVEDPMRPAIDLRLPSHPTRRLRIAQRGRASWWWWSVSDIFVGR